MKTKIAFFIINHSWVGGVERVTSSLIRIFNEKEYNIHSLISFGCVNKVNEIINYPDSLIIKSVNRKNLFTDLSAYLKEEKITHLIFQGDNMSISKTILSVTNKLECKAYLHYHGSPYAYLKKNLYWNDIKENPINLFKIIFANIVYPFKKKKLFNNIKKSTDGFIAVSNGVKNELFTLFNKEFSNVKTIHNPISFHLKKEVILNKKENKIIFVSRLERKDKNAFLSIKAWELIHEKYPDWELQILGNGNLKEKMELFAKSKHIKNCNFLGHVHNVDAYLDKSEISILTSDCEGFGMGIFESLACKNAIVSTNSFGGVSDLVTNGYNGFIVGRNDAKLLAKKIEQLINDDDLRRKMGNNSLARYQNLIDENVFAQWQLLLDI